MVAERRGPFGIHPQERPDVVPRQGFEFLVFRHLRSAGEGCDGERRDKQPRERAAAAGNVPVHEFTIHFFLRSSIFSISSITLFIFFIASSNGAGLVMSIPAFFRSSIG